MPWAFAAVAIVAEATIATRSLAARMLVLRHWGLYARLGFLPRVSCKCPKKLVNRWPANDAHEGVDVTRCLGPEVDVVGVFIHIECQDRRASRQCMTMVGCPLI